jgi:hypothetical protein
MYIYKTLTRKDILVPLSQTQTPYLQEWLKHWETVGWGILGEKVTWLLGWKIH